MSCLFECTSTTHLWQGKPDSVRGLSRCHLREAVLRDDSANPSPCVQQLGPVGDVGKRGLVCLCLDGRLLKERLQLPFDRLHFLLTWLAGDI